MLLKTFLTAERVSNLLCVNISYRVCVRSAIWITITSTPIWIVVAGVRAGSSRDTPKAVPMFEMWSSTTSKLEVAQHQQQHPHTSSGSIKGAFHFHDPKLYRLLVFASRNVETDLL